MNRRTDHCESCRFFIEWLDASKGQPYPGTPLGLGECRRYPPTINWSVEEPEPDDDDPSPHPVANGEWPIVYLESVCGEYEEDPCSELEN